MYRLGCNLSRFHATLNNSTAVIYRLECPFCKNVFTSTLNPNVIYHNPNFTSRMFLTTRAKPLEKVKKKLKKSKTLQKYIELIQISEKNTKESLEVKAKLKKSTAENTLKQFGVITTKLEKEKEPKSPKKSVDELQIKKTKPLEKTADEVALERAEEEKWIQDLREQRRKNILAFIDVCVNTKQLSLATSTLFAYANFRDTGAKDIKIYNCVLEALAAKGDYYQINKILSAMLSSESKPNLQSYIYALECAYRTKAFNKIEVILQNIKSNGLDINNILFDCKFVSDQRDIVFKAIRLQIKDFNPVKPDIPRGYICNLLNELNGNKSQDMFNNPLEHGKLNLQSLTNQQLKMEKDGYMKIHRIDNKSIPIDENTKTYRKKLEECEQLWKKDLLTGLKKKLGQLQFQLARKRNRKTEIYCYLLTLQPEELVDLMFKEFVTIAQFSETFSPMMNFLYSNLGNKVMERYHISKRIKNGVFDQTMKLYESYCKFLSDPQLTSQHIPRDYWELLKEKFADGPNIDIPNIIWPSAVRIGVGEFLFDILRELKFDSNVLKSKTTKEKKNLVSAFYTLYRSHKVVREREEIKPHPVLSKLYKVAKLDHLIFDASLLPMLSPPLPWTSIQHGGHIITQTQLIRHPGVEIDQQLDRLYHQNIQNIYPCLDSLSALGKIPWIINKPVLDVVIDVFLNKGSKELDIPQPQSECPPSPTISITMTKQEVQKALIQKKELRQQRCEMFSLWCEMLYKLSIANEFRDKVLWFPHNVDFRGRTYPCPPHLNHLGSDVSRSILMFAKGEPLGENGLDWLKIHLVNLTGFKKRFSQQERLDYCNDMIPEIMDSADKPLNGNGWWKTSDEPWQTLASCMEVAKVLRSPNPTSYICHFPVHQDGSCNGLQHYAALGRDIEGAEQVNLRPSNLPQDVYSRVAEMVEEERKIDADEGNRIAQLLEGRISRRVVKQPVMTTVYGVTHYGARRQIMRRLEEISDFSKEDIFPASAYIVEKIFSCLETMFCSTKDIQEWFTRSAKLISRTSKQPVEWVTPIGFPVVQPYFTKDTKDKTKQKFTRKEEVPDSRKQANGFPPNYIHSLDSTHMMMTALHCERQDLTFVSVHDCFWTHPNTVEEMNRICREQFVALHSEPLLEMLSEFHLQVYCSQKNPEEQNYILKRWLTKVPKKGAFDLKEVLKSTYFFS